MTEKKKPVRKYELYHNGGDIYSRSAEYSHGDYLCMVKAKSIKQAYWLLAHNVVYDETTKVGVYFIDNSDGPGYHSWPFTVAMRKVAPEWWNYHSDFKDSIGIGR